MNLAAEAAELAPELEAAAARVIRSGRYILGPEVEAFEREAAARLGAAHAVAVNSATDALTMALIALGVRPGDEVIVPAFTFIATASAVIRAGARPVFADIEPVSCGLDPEEIRRRATARTRAVIPVHLFGQPARIGEVVQAARARGLVVVEDCAQAFGAARDGRKAGTFGDAAAFSFYPTKTLAALGDGGLLVAAREEVAARARAMRDHGQTARYRAEFPGFNSRLDEIQAAFLRVRLRHLERRLARLEEAAIRYDTLLDGSGVARVRAAGDVKPVFPLYVIRVPDGRRDALRQALRQSGIATEIHYPVPLHRMEAFAADVALPNAEAACAEVLSLPVWPGIPQEDQERVAAIVSRFSTSGRGTSL